MTWFEHFLTAVTVVIASWGYWGVAVGMAIESANIPLPSEVILPFGGYLVSTGRLEFYRTVMAGTVGGVVGSILSYYLGVWGGRPFLVKYGRYFGFSMDHLALADRWFKQYGEATVFFTRLMPIVRTFISLPAGIARMDFKKFVVYSFFGSLPWSLLLVYIGLKLGQNWQSIKGWLHGLDALVVVGIAILIIYLWQKKRKRYR
ncbi:MAG: DedA family protein [Desulfotomaculaceae bacterium]|nr:DedA family protein [Desulfotomaculaceae bacterium]